MQDWNPPVKPTTTTAQAGPLMMRHLIDGHEVLLPADAKLHPRLWPNDKPDPNESLGGCY